MAEQKEVAGWRKKFLANRMSFESILFEKELLVRERENRTAGPVGALAIGLFASLLTAQWALRRGYLFTAADSAGFQTAYACLEHLKAGGFWSLFRPLSGGLGAPVVPPLYYLTYAPVLEFITGDLNWAMILVNGFYLTGLALAVFTAIRKNRPNKSGWIGACMVMAMPFVLEAARHPDYRLASVTLAAAAYAAFINSEEFENPFWNSWFGFFFGLGFFADHMFWLYMAPLFPFIVSGLAGPRSNGAIFKGLIPGALLSLPWYAFASVSWAIKYFSGPAPHSFRPGLWNCLTSLSGAAGLPLFLLGALAMLWMYFSVFMPYSSRKIVAAWFWVPFLAVYYLFNGRPEYMYPALPSMAVAIAVMTPGRVWKYSMGFALLLLIVNQSGFAGPVFMGRARIAGLQKPSWAQYRAPELLAGLKSMAAGKTISAVALAGEGESFDPASFANLSGKMGGAAMKFGAYRPETLGLADFVVYKTSVWGASGSGGRDELPREISRPWFGKVFSRAAEFDLQETSRLVLYAKNPVTAPPLPEGKYRLAKTNLGGIFMEDGSIELSGFDPARGVYSEARVYSPYATLDGFDIYGLALEITGFSCYSAGGSVTDLRMTGAEAVKIVSAKISNYAFERYLAGKYPGLENIEVSFNRTAKIWCERGGKRIYMEFSLSAQPPELALRLEDLNYAGHRAPDFLTRMFEFKYNLSALPAEVRFNRIKLARQMLEIS